PGVAGTVATSFDGYPMAKRGEAGRALGLAAFSSVTGGVISLCIFLVAAPLGGYAFQAIAGLLQITNAVLAVEEAGLMLVQGYYFAEPMPFDALVRGFEQRR
ncbi:tripartite tricarboxylate transporter permease, partial [Halochromatium sp.]